MKLAVTRQKCPKCQGKLFFDRAYYADGNLINWYEEATCLQCGFTCACQSPTEPPPATTQNQPIPARLIPA